MNEAALRALIDRLRAGTVSADDAVAQLRRMPFADLGDAKIDHHRALRQGQAEVVYGPGKTPEQCVAIVDELRRAAGGPVIVTRAVAEQIQAVQSAHPDVVVRDGQPATILADRADPRSERVAVVTAGTADGPVASECLAVLEAHGLSAVHLTDVGVAGIHRLFSHLDELLDIDVVVVVAGMEGALASVIGGLVAVPVIAVPTSVGYGSSLEGVTALLGMLASCAAGVTVVGIDNGFGAAAAVMRQLGSSAPPDAGTTGEGTTDG